MLSRLLAFVVSLASMVVVGLAFWPQVIGLQRTSPWSFMVSSRGLALIIALVAFIVLLALGRLGRPLRRVLMAAGGWLVVFAVATGWMMWSRGFGTPWAQGSVDTVRVLEWNTMGKAVSPEEVTQVALEANADVIALPETTRQSADAIVAALGDDGVDMVAFTVSFDATYDAHSTSLLVRSSLGSYALDDAAAQTAVSPTVVIRPTSGSGPTIVAAHAVAPSLMTMEAWRSDLGVLADLCREADVILAGDLNATVDTMQGLGARNLGDCSDAALVTRDASVGTWPTWLPPLVGAPLDHVMSTATWRATGTTVIVTSDSAGSDHRPLVAQLQRVSTP